MQFSNADTVARGSADILCIEELVFFPEGQEMGEERVEMRLHLQVKEVSEMGVEDMRKHAEKLTVNVFCCRREICWEWAPAIGWEDGLVVQ